MRVQLGNGAAQTTTNRKPNACPPVRHEAPHQLSELPLLQPMISLTKIRHEVLRISRAESLPVSASKHRHSRNSSKLTRDIGNSTCPPSLTSHWRAREISVLTHSLRIWLSRCHAFHAATLAPNFSRCFGFPALYLWTSRRLFGRFRLRSASVEPDRLKATSLYNAHCFTGPRFAPELTTNH